jgi:hypothetical protein
MNGEDHEGPVEGRLEDAMRAMRAIEVPGPPEELIRRARPAMLRAHRRRLWREGAPRLAAAAAIALAMLAAAALVTQTRPSRALADVAGRVDATRTLRAVVVGPRERGTLLASGTRTRFEGDGTVVIADSAARREVMLQEGTKSAFRIPRQGGGRALDFYGVFRELAASASAPIEEYVDAEGRRFPGLRGRASLKVGPDAEWTVVADVWSDPATKLPVRLELRPEGGGREDAFLVERIEFDVALDEALFDMAIPPGYSLVGIDAARLGPAPSGREAEKLTIVPGAGIGDVTFGMSREQVVGVLGEPEFTMHDVYLCYPSKGLQLVLVGREPDKLGMIIANPMDAPSLTRNEFPGRTDKGIRIGSSEREVRDAYGEPDPPLPSDRGSHARVARYAKLGMMFGFTDGQVRQMIVNRTN